MKIIIIGAGQGGLQAAKLLAQAGIDTEIYEKSNRDELCYDWTDDVDRKVFSDLGIPVPEGSYPSCGPSLIAPFSDKPIKVHLEEEKMDWTIERRPLSAELVDMAEKAGAIIHFGSPVASLYFEDEKVAGITVGKNDIECDLVIDCSGVNSPFRESLPDSYKITKKVDPSEVFYVYRAHYEANKNAEIPTKHTKKIYLKHLGEQGISWCVYEPTGEVNVLIGRTNALPKSVFENAFSDLKNDNPIIGDKLLRGGEFCTIPVRHALSRMIGDGYAAIGDAAFMTIPLIGSGISASWRAGTILAEKIIADNSTDLETLWKYQTEYYKEIGAEHYSIDMLKRALLSADSEDIRFFFDNGIITEQDLNSISTGSVLAGNKAELLSKAFKALKKTGFLLNFASAIRKGNKAVAIAKSIPEEFDEEAVTLWQVKLESMFISKQKRVAQKVPATV